MELQRYRERLPAVAFLLLLVVALLLLGFACACVGDHPAVAIERALAAVAGLPPLIEIWTLLVLALGPAAIIFVSSRAAVVRGSPAELQRFLF